MYSWREGVCADFLLGAGAFSLHVPMFFFLSSCLPVCLVMIQCDTIPICLDGVAKYNYRTDS